MLGRIDSKPEQGGGGIRVPPTDSAVWNSVYLFHYLGNEAFETAFIPRPEKKCPLTPSVSSDRGSELTLTPRPLKYPWPLPCWSRGVQKPCTKWNLDHTGHTVGHTEPADHSMPFLQSQTISLKSTCLAADTRFCSITAIRGESKVKFLKPRQ